MSQDHLARFFIGVKERERLCSVVRCSSSVAPHLPCSKTSPLLKLDEVTSHKSLYGPVTSPKMFTETW